MSAEQATYFREIKKFDQLWMQLLVVGTAALIWYFAIYAADLWKPVGNYSEYDNSLVIMWLTSGIVFLIFMYSMSLVVEVRNSGLYFQFYPFHLSLKRTPFQDIRSYGVREYRPLRDCGGWG